MDDISALAAVSMDEATAAEGAVLGRCLHLCRPQVQIWQMHFSSAATEAFLEAAASLAEDGFFAAAPASGLEAVLVCILCVFSQINPRLVSNVRQREPNSEVCSLFSLSSSTSAV
jgi:hypothetical protein